MFEHSNRSVSGLDAKFIVLQEMDSGETIALYNITAIGHPLFGSMVTNETLRELDFKVPSVSLRVHEEEKKSMIT